jgi:hypothetical protein
MAGGSRKKFYREQESYLTRSDSPLSDLRHGVYLGSEEYGQHCVEMARGVPMKEKPQKRQLLRQRSAEQLAHEILERLGEKAPEDLFVLNKKKRPVRDLCIYMMSRLGAYTHKEIGGVFSVGYTAISGSIKRAEFYLQNNKLQKNLVERTINDLI